KRNEERHQHAATVLSLLHCSENPLKSMERVKGIEPSSQAWEAHILPLNHTRGCEDALVLSVPHCRCNPPDQSRRRQLDTIIRAPSPGSAARGGLTSSGGATCPSRFPG